MFQYIIMHFIFVDGTILIIFTEYIPKKDILFLMLRSLINGLLFPKGKRFGPTLIKLEVSPVLTVVFLLAICTLNMDTL
ncbi:hypothetical protein HK13_10855 [Acetobacter indonesiensis]|nr:hypothetical protein HK13_10855 [Acetobacter indonesiensis]